MTSKKLPPQHQIRELISQMNEAWAKGHPEKLASLFHEDIVMVHPDFTGRSEGRAACVASYAEFCNQATIHGVISATYISPGPRSGYL